MFQDDVMFPWRSVLDNVIVPLEIAGVKKQEAKKQALTFLKEFGLEKFASYYPFMLSGGMRERASLLRTYLCKKDVMLLDEPFSKLDALTRQKMQQWFLEVIQKKQKTVLFVTHDVDEAIFLSDRIYVLSQRPGTVVGEMAVSIRKPRSIDVVVSPEFITIKKHILRLLKQ
jgi:ABC-type nitrate/sulfonate/bicarbonate transport system ATPase subunit